MHEYFSIFNYVQMFRVHSECVQNFRVRSEYIQIYT
jgi:hypothetical protein